MASKKPVFGFSARLGLLVFISGTADVLRANLSGVMPWSLWDLIIGLSCITCGTLLFLWGDA